MSLYQIKTTTPEDHAALLSFLILAGYEYPSAPTLDDYNSEYGPFAYPQVIVYENKHLGGNDCYDSDFGPELVYPQDITEIFNRVLEIDDSQVFLIKNVGDYEAIVTKDSIRVGCQTITLEKFAEISKAVATIRK